MVLPNLQEMTYAVDFSFFFGLTLKRQPSIGVIRTHRPPCTLIIGLPVLVIVTSCNPRREISGVEVLQALLHCVTARSPHIAEGQFLCMAMVMAMVNQATNVTNSSLFSDPKLPEESDRMRGLCSSYR